VRNTTSSIQKEKRLVSGFDVWWLFNMTRGEARRDMTFSLA